MHNKFDEFEKDMTKEEIEEMMDSLVLSVAEDCQKADDINSVLNFKRAKELMCVYNIMKALTKGTKAKVTYEINEPYKSMGSVSVIGRGVMLPLYNAEWFTAACKLASNFNVYPRTDGSVRMDFTFHGMTTPIKEDK